LNGRRIATLALLALSALPACTPKPPPEPASAPEPQRSYPPMDLGGQRVLIVPLQAAEGLPGTREDATRDIVLALSERDARTLWITPEQLRSSLRRAPGYAQDPGALPRDTYRHHGESFIQEPLAGILRRYSALTDSRAVLIPRAARWVPWTDRPGGRIRMAAAVVDSRAGTVIWMGEADGLGFPEASREAVASGATALAQRMVIPSSR
jgi:hypothetical protein